MNKAKAQALALFFYFFRFILFAYENIHITIMIRATTTTTPRTALMAPVKSAKKNFVPKIKMKISAAKANRGINSFIISPYTTGPNLDKTVVKYSGREHSRCILSPLRG